MILSLLVHVGCTKFVLIKFEPLHARIFGAWCAMRDHFVADQEL